MSSPHTPILRVLDTVPLPRLLHGTVEVRQIEPLSTSVPWSTHSLPFNQANCEANPDFKPVASGGNGDSVQYCKTLICNLGV